LYKQDTDKLKWINNEITVRLYGDLNIYKIADSTVVDGRQHTVFFHIFRSFHYNSITKIQTKLGTKFY